MDIYQYNTIIKEYVVFHVCFVIHAVTFHLPMGSCAHGKPGKVLEISMVDTLSFAQK